MATGSFDHTARIWDVEGGTCINNLGPPHKDLVVSSNFNNDGTKLVTAGFDGVV